MISTIQYFIKQLVSVLAKLWSSIPDDQKKTAIAFVAKMMREYWAKKYDEYKANESRTGTEKSKSGTDNIPKVDVQ